VNKKTIAVGSGKGGVGKSTVSVNLALYYSRKGLTVCLIDLDPLSDITTILDIRESEQALHKSPPLETGSGIEPFLLPVFQGLDLLAPYQNTEDKQAGNMLFGKIQESRERLETTYDVIILDLPAGMEEEEHLQFLDFAGHVIIVTQAEPTAHVSAGYYIKRILEYGCSCSLYLWHNRYSPRLDADFNPADVIGNFNGNVPEEDRLDRTSLPEISHVAYVPEDPSMDLLRANSSPLISVLTSLQDTLHALYESRVTEHTKNSNVPTKSIPVLAYYLKLNKNIENSEAYLEDLEHYFLHFLTSRINKETGAESVSVQESSGVALSDKERAECRAIVEAVKDDKIASSARILIKLLDGTVEEVTRASSFSVSSETGKRKDIDREFAVLLTRMKSDGRHEHNGMERNFAGLLLFYFALFKLMNSPSVVRLIEQFVPKKKSQGDNDRYIRDRNTQIKYLIEKSDQYRNGFLKMIKTLFPLVMKQVGVIAKTFELYPLIFRRKDGINSSVYAKLLSSFLHNSLNGGLGIIVGFPFRPASIAFGEASETLLKHINHSAETDTNRKN
jgi:flagellar biosynthesis protein FlhG